MDRARIPLQFRGESGGITWRKLPIRSQPIVGHANTNNLLTEVGHILFFSIQEIVTGLAEACCALCVTTVTEPGAEQRVLVGYASKLVPCMDC